MCCEVAAEVVLPDCRMWNYILPKAKERLGSRREARADMLQRQHRACELSMSLCLSQSSSLSCETRGRCRRSLLGVPHGHIRGDDPPSLHCICFAIVCDGCCDGATAESKATHRFEFAARTTVKLHLSHFCVSCLILRKTAHEARSRRPFRSIVRMLEGGPTETALSAKRPRRRLPLQLGSRSTQVVYRSVGFDEFSSWFPYSEKKPRLGHFPL